jgi:hypothetical protein
MHPGRLVFIFHLEESVRDSTTVRKAEHKNTRSIIIAVPHSMPPDRARPNLGFLTNAGIEITQKKDLATRENISEDPV